MRASTTIVEMPTVSTSLDGDERPRVMPPSVSPAASSGVRVFAAVAARPAPVTRLYRCVVIVLVIMANFAQFISNCVTIGAGIELSRLLGNDVGPGKANWMAAAYPLTQGAFVLISGRLGAIYGHQLFVLVGTAMLAVFSLVNGYCRTYRTFVLARALTGIGGGLVMPNAVAVVTTLVPPGRARNISLGCFGAAAPVGGWLGVLLAGVFVERVSWPWVFYFLAILAAVLLVSLVVILKTETPVDQGGKVDYLGAFFGLGALLLFNFAWNQAPSAGWSSASAVAPLAVSVPMFGVFLGWEARYAKEPIMPLGLFRTPTFSALVFVVLLSYMSFGISLWYMVAWQQLERGWSILQFAVGWLPFVFGASLAVGAAAWLIPRVSAQWIMAVGVGAALGANLLLATMPAQQTYWAQTFPAVLLGSVCPDFVYVAAQLIASNSVGRREQGVAGSLIGTLNLYGNSLGLGFAGTIETELTKGRSGSPLYGYRAALYFGVALAALGLLLDFAFVRVPKDEREGWQGEEENVAMGPVVGQATGVEAAQTVG